MTVAKKTLRHSGEIDYDVFYSQNLCLLIWLSWTVCYWTESKLRIITKSVLPNIWLFISLVSPMFRHNEFGCIGWH